MHVNDMGDGPQLVNHAKGTIAFQAILDFEEEENAGAEKEQNAQGRLGRLHQLRKGCDLKVHVQVAHGYGEHGQAGEEQK
jgi:hypothetical protein